MTSAIALLAILVCQGPNNYQRLKTQSGIPMGWKNMPITYYINRGGSSQISDGSDIAAVKKGFRVWSEVKCAAVRFSYGGEITSPSIGYTEGGKNYNAVIWIKSAARWPFPYDVLATTQLYWDERTGEILDADILFNDFGFKWSTSSTPPSDRYDILNTAVHEIGHLLGLDHSDRPEATMYFQSPSGEVKKRDLDRDDVRGICQIYPKNGKKISFEIITSDAGDTECPPEKLATSERKKADNPPTQCSSAAALPPLLPLLLLLLAMAKGRTRLSLKKSP